MLREACGVGIVLVFATGCRAAVVEPTLPPAWPESMAAEPLSRADCIDLAARSAPNAAAWKARLLAARASLEQAQNLPNPALSIAWEDFGLNHAAAESVVQTTATLAVALEDVFARKRRTTSARHELDAEEADLRAEEAKLAAEVSRAYDTLVGAHARVGVEDELVALALRQREDVEKFVSSGLVPRIDLERADAELAQSRSDLTRAGAKVRALETELAFSLGFDRPVSLRLSDALTTKIQAPRPELIDMLAAAANGRGEIAAATARYQAELERLRLAAERIQFLPTIAAGPRKQGDELRGVASLDVVLPIFDSGAAREHAEQASLLAAAASLRATAHDVAREVCAAFERLTAAETGELEGAREMERRRRELRERTDRLFRAGEAAYSELALARRDEVQARLALLDAEIAVATARVDLDAATGALTRGRTEL